MLAFLVSVAMIGADAPALDRINAYFLLGVTKDKTVAIKTTTVIPGANRVFAQITTNKKYENRKGINRVYKEGELITKWGEPSSRKDGTVQLIAAEALPREVRPYFPSGVIVAKAAARDEPYIMVPRTQSLGQTGQTETWTWNCEGGTISVTFLLLGYGVEGDPATKRLLLMKAPSITHGKAKSGKSGEERIWKSVDGTVLAKGRFVKMNPDTIWVEEKDGTRLTISKDKLSADDLTYLESR